MADMLDLFKVGALLFSRDPLRTWQRVDEMKAAKQNTNALDSLFGPMQTQDPGATINWNTPRPVEGASPQMQQLLQNPVIAQLLQAPQFRQQMGQAVVSDIMPKGPPKLQEVAPGASLVPIDVNTGLPMTTGTFTAHDPNKRTPNASLVTLKGADGIERTFNAATQQAEIEAAIGAGAREVKTPPNQINMNMGGDKAVTGVDAKRYEQTTSTLATLDGMAPFLERMQGALASGAQTGFGQNWALAAKQAAEEAFGTTFQGTSEQEVFKSVQNYLGPKMRAPGSGASSDRDVSLFLDSIPSLSKSEGGNAKLLEMYSRIRDRYTQIAQIQQDLLRENDYIPISKEREAFAKLPPIFSPEERKQITTLKETAKSGGNVVNQEMPPDSVKGEDGWYRSPSMPGKRFKPAGQ